MASVLENQARAEVERLSKYAPQRQFEELAVRVKGMSTATSPQVLARSGAFNPDYELDAGLMGPQDALAEFGKNWWASFVNQLYPKVCSKDGEWHKAIVDAVGNGATSVGVALATMMVTGIGTAPAIAGAVAAIIASQYFKGVLAMGGEAAVDAACKSLKDNLPPKPNG